MWQSVFLFDYLRFREEIGPIVHALDRGDYMPLYEWQNRIVQSMKPEEWILHDEGTDLDSSEPSEGKDNFTLGYWLLIVLSSFLRRPLSLSIHWGLIGAAIQLVDNRFWPMTAGTPTAALIKPGSELSTPTTLSDSDPYWYWVRPVQTYNSDWQSLEQIRLLEQRLVSKRGAIMKVDQRKLPKLAYAAKDRQASERIARLHSSYDDLLKLYRTAIEEGVGLYWILSFA